MSALSLFLCSQDSHSCSGDILDRASKSPRSESPQSSSPNRSFSFRDSFDEAFDEDKNSTVLNGIGPITINNADLALLSKFKRKSDNHWERMANSMIDSLGLEKAYQVVLSNTPEHRKGTYYPSYFYDVKTPFIYMELKVFCRSDQKPSKKGSKDRTKGRDVRKKVKQSKSKISSKGEASAQNRNKPEDKRKQSTREKTAPQGDRVLKQKQKMGKWHRGNNTPILQC